MLLGLKTLIYTHGVVISLGQIRHQNFSVEGEPGVYAAKAAGYGLLERLHLGIVREEG